MIARLVLFTLLNAFFLFLDYKKRKDIKKTIISIIAFIAIISAGYMGYILMRIVAPLFFIHILFIVAAYLALLWYLLRGKLYYYIIASPILTIIFYFILNFFDGSRYEV